MDPTLLPNPSPDAADAADAVLRGRWAVVGIVLLGLAVAAIRLAGPSDLMDNEQQLQSAYVMDAIQNGHWLCQRDETGSITSKPPVYTWLAALATLPAGRINRLSMCLPSILGTIGLALLLLQFGRKYAGDEAGFLAAAVYLLSYATARQIGLARMDGLFPFTTTLAALAAFAAWTRGRSWIWFWLAAAVATLTKGPVAVLVGGAGLVAALTLRRGTGLQPVQPEPDTGSKPVPRQLIENAAGILLFLLITLGWFGASCEVMGRAVYRKLILDGLLGQSVQTHNGHWPGQQFYVPPFYLLTRFFPWSILACLNLWRIWRKPAQDPSVRRFEQFTQCWLLVGLIPFCIAPHQRADLIAPVYPPAALLAGRELAHLLRACSARLRTLLFAAGAALALCGFIIKYDLMAKNEPSVIMTRSVRELAQSIEQQVGPDFPLTHVDDPFALQFYLNTMRPTVSYEEAAQLLKGSAAAYVVICSPAELHVDRFPEGKQVYDVAQSARAGYHHVLHVLSNRPPPLQTQNDIAMADGSLQVETSDGLHWVHAAEHDFVFSGRGRVSFMNVGMRPVEVRAVLQRTGQPLRVNYTLQPGETRDCTSGG